MEGNRKMTGCLQTFGGHCIFDAVFSHLSLTNKINKYVFSYIIFTCYIIDAYTRFASARTREIKVHEAIKPLDK